MDLAEKESSNQSELARGFLEMPLVRQVSLMITSAASVALLMLVAVWSWQPNQAVLFNNMDSVEATDVMAVLQEMGVDYNLDQNTGAIMVPANRVHNLRLRMAREGLPRTSGVGLEILKEDPKFGTSQFMETARYQHALEEEMVQSITSLNSVESARVHLALPTQSVFVRKRKKASASVVVNLHAGRSLDASQVEAISHMVAASIPNLEPNEVTIVDARGNLLTKKSGTSGLDVSEEQLRYTKNLEDIYIERIISLIAPIVGDDKLRAQVSADLDFTATEQTRESFNPDLPALRSQQISEKENSGSGGPVGIPGALSNQPPGAGNAPEIATADGAASGGPFSKSRNATMNYELDRTISHVRSSIGMVKRLSIAVALNHRMVKDAEGNTNAVPRSEEELRQITELVKQAVGYNGARGDTINVINTAFEGTQTYTPAALPIWKETWFVDYVKAALGVLLIIIFFLTVLRPVLRRLADNGLQSRAAELESMGIERGALQSHAGGLDQDEDARGSEGSTLIHMPTPGAYEENIKMVTKVVNDDPALVAQVVKAWISGE